MPKVGVLMFCRNSLSIIRHILWFVDSKEKCDSQDQELYSVTAYKHVVQDTCPVNRILSLPVYIVALGPPHTEKKRITRVCNHRAKVLLIKTELHSFQVLSG